MNHTIPSFILLFRSPPPAYARVREKKFHFRPEAGNNKILLCTVQPRQLKLEYVI